jgi:hypothetical protein
MVDGAQAARPVRPMSERPNDTKEIERDVSTASRTRKVRYRYIPVQVKYEIEKLSRR